MIQENGIIHIQNFLSDDQIQKLNIEIDKISEQFLINGNSRASVWLNHNQFDILNPIVNIQSINLLDIAFKIYKKLKETTSTSYTLTTLRIVDEKKNIHPIDWHTDIAQNHIRGLLYLIGGDENNGNLSYILKSHKDKHEGSTHNIDIKKLNLESKVYKCSSKPGDLILLDINGIHKKNIVNQHRRILYFEFQDQNSKKRPKTKIIFLEKTNFSELEFLLSKAKLLISCHGAATHVAAAFNIKIIDIFDNSKITKQMIHDSNFLFYDSNETKLIDPIHHYNLILYTPLKIYKYYLTSFFKLQIKKILKKFNFN